MPTYTAKTRLLTARPRSKRLRELGLTSVSISNTENTTISEGTAETVDLSECEKIANKVTSIDSNSTDEQYPTAKAVWDAVNDNAPVQSDWNQTDTTALDFIKNKPTIPTKTSDLTNDSGFLASHQDISMKANTADLATVATSGDYDDLSNRPTIPAAQIQSDWNQSDNTSLDYIKNKPTIPTTVTVDSALDASSTNAVQNAAIVAADNEIYDVIYSLHEKEFTIGSHKTIQFSPGNLQYQPSTQTWRFATQQYSCVGNNPANTLSGTDLSTSDEWVDIFIWGTAITNPIARSGYAASFEDWGANAIVNGSTTDAANTWRTLTCSEMQYLCNSRHRATSLRGFATVVGVQGLLLLPDAWRCPDNLTFTPTIADFTTNSYNSNKWSMMQGSGAIFLPCARPYNDGLIGLYNLADSVSTYGHAYLYFEADNLKVQYQNMGPSTAWYKNYTESVRLVKDVNKVDYNDLTGTPTVDSALDANSTNAVQNGVITSALNNKADASHTHTSSDITDFATQLATKAAASHTHGINDIELSTAITTFNGTLAQNSYYELGSIASLTINSINYGEFDTNVFFTVNSASFTLTLPSGTGIIGTLPTWTVNSQYVLSAYKGTIVVTEINV